MLDTSQEIFDIYDQNDAATGQTKPRDYVHKTLVDWHRVTCIWIVNDKKQLLCQQRSFKKDVHPGMWQLTFGGHLQTGQTYDQNALLELNEELGLTPSLDNLINLGKANDPKHKHHAMCYIYHWNGNLTDLVFNDGEVEQVIQVTLDEYQHMIDSGQNAYRINPKLREYLNNLK
jgi:isopentenyldiphosphate isomerase